MRSKENYSVSSYPDCPIGHSGEINRNKFPEGSVVYYVKQNGYKREVGYGTVEANYTSEVCIKMYELRELRRINGIPLREFVTPTRWQKLPKDWSYDTHLFNLTYDDFPDENFKERVDSIDIRNPEDIMAAIREGILVPVRDIDHCKIEDEIDKHLGFRIIRKHPQDEGLRHPWYTSVRFYQAYATYEEAKAVCDKHDAEFQAQANMTEAEWSISLIDDDLKIWANRYDHSEDEVRQYREWLLALDKIEDVETRIYDGEIQYKYWNKNKWMNIEL